VDWRWLVVGGFAYLWSKLFSAGREESANLVPLKTTGAARYAARLSVRLIRSDSLMSRAPSSLCQQLVARLVWKIRSKQYSSITAATALLSLSSPERTTRPVQFTWTSVSVPSTEAGSTMRNRMMAPTPRLVFVWKRTPPAEMSAVSAKYSWASSVLTVIGRRSGNRTELLVSAAPKPATGVLISFTHAPLL